MTYAEFNRAIDFAIEQGSEAASFLRSWREGDVSEWPEFPQLLSAPAAPQPAQQNYLEMIYEYLVSTTPVGYADEAFRQVPEEVFATDSRNRISERRASLSQHTGTLSTASGQEEVGTRQAGCDVTSAQQPLTDEQMWEIWIPFARAIEQAHGIGVKND